MYKTGYPWLTKEAVEFMYDYLKSDMDVLEYGMGGSTVWMAKRCNVTSIESKESWYDETRNMLKEKHLEARLVLQRRPYHNAVNGLFDFILVDGRDRVMCFNYAKKMLKKGGVIMLDNSEREQYRSVFEETEWDYVTTSGPDYTGTFDYPGWNTTYWICP